MVITRRTARPLGSFQDEMNRLFGDLGSIETRRAFSPAMDISGDDNAYYVEVEVPGFTMDNLDISFHDGELVVAGSISSDVTQGNGSDTTGTTAQNETDGATTVESTTETSETTYFRRERRMDSFTRTVRVPADVDAEAIEATLEHGVLRVTLPKAEQVRPRKIQVRQG